MPADDGDGSAPPDARLALELPRGLPTSPHISPHPPTSPYISPHLPTSPWSGLPFISVSGPELLDKYIGASEAKVRVRVRKGPSTHHVHPPVRGE